jgi:hypothetical protein
MKRHEDYKDGMKKAALTAGLVALIVAVAGPAHAKDTPVRIDTVTPAVFGAGADIVIKGSGFLPEDTVSLGALKLEGVKIKPTSIQASVPVKAKTGPKLMVHRNKKKVTTFSDFTFVKAPLLRKTRPAFGVPGGSITIQGANLETIDKLTINKTSVEINSTQKSSLTFVVPKGLVTGPLTVSGPGGTATLKKPFEVFYPPVIEKIEPKAAFPDDKVTVSGAHFDTKGLRFYIGKKKVKHDEVSTKKATFIVPKNATSAVIRATARKITTVSQSPFRVYLVPKVNGTPGMVASPGFLQVRGKNLEVVEQWSINGKKLKVDTSFAKGSSKRIQLTIPEDMNTKGVVTAKYKDRNFSAKKSTTIAAAPRIDAVRFGTDASGTGCEYTVLGKNISEGSLFKLGKKKLKLVSITDKGAVLGIKGACSSKYNQISAKNGRFAGNTYTFNPNAGGYTATHEESLARLTAGSTDYTPKQILSDLSLMESRFAGTSQSWGAQGKAAGKSAEQRSKVDRISEDLGYALIRLALAEEALCAAMAPGRKAAAANTSFGVVLDQVAKKEQQLMKNVLIPLWSALPKTALSNKGVRLNTVDDKVVVIGTVEQKKKTCSNRFYGKKLIAEAGKVAAVNLTALHEQALTGALSNLSQKNKNSVVMEKELNDALYSFNSTRRSYWVKKAKSASATMQKSMSKTVGKGAGKNKQIKKSTKQKSKGNTGKGKGK